MQVAYVDLCARLCGMAQLRDAYAAVPDDVKTQTRECGICFSSSQASQKFPNSHRSL